MKTLEAKRIENVSEYYFSTKLQQINLMNANGMQIINLGIGNPDLPPSENTVSALIQSASENKNHGYQSYKGIKALRSAISDYYSKIYRTQTNPETEILPLIGSKEGIFHITMTFVNDGETVLIPNPAYPAYEAVSKLAGAKVLKYNLLEEKNWAVDIEQIKSFDLKKVKILWINFPNMPTGAQPDINTFDELIYLARKFNFLIVNDNPYSTILNAKPFSLMSLKNAFSNCLEINSMSKSHNMAGWRLGWIVARKNYIDSVLKFKSNIDSGMFLPVQLAAVEAFSNSEEWFINQNKIYSDRRNLACEILDSLNCKYDKNQGGLYVWAKIPDSFTDSETFAEHILASANVFVTPGFIFGSNGNKFIRISLTNSESDLQKALLRIKQTSISILKPIL